MLELSVSTNWVPGGTHRFQVELVISQAITKGFLSAGHKARQWYLTNGQDTQKCDFAQAQANS